MQWIIIATALSYLIGSIPTAYLFGRALKGIDIRNFGSGNVGATNALRVLGKGPGIAVLCLDILKGFLAVIIIGNIIDLRTTIIPQQALRIILGLSCICGHNWTVFLKFKGGKGIATTLGVLLGLSIKIGGLRLILILVILTWLLVFVITKTISLASILAGMSLPIYMALLKQSNMLVYVGILLFIFVLLRHRANLKRLFRGTEPRISFKKKP